MCTKEKNHTWHGSFFYETGANLSVTFNYFMHRYIAFRYENLECVDYLNTFLFGATEIKFIVMNPNEQESRLKIK